MVLDWVLEHAGLRVHGTTQEVPLAVFEAREKPALLPLPSSPFELLEWKRATAKMNGEESLLMAANPPPSL